MIFLEGNTEDWVNGLRSRKIRAIQGQEDGADDIYALSP